MNWQLNAMNLEARCLLRNHALRSLTALRPAESKHTAAAPRVEVQSTHAQTERASACCLYCRTTKA
jgi:hypothetical protein